MQVSMGLRVHVLDAGGYPVGTDVVGAWQDDTLSVRFSATGVEDACSDTGCHSHASSKGHHTMPFDPNGDLMAFFYPAVPYGTGLRFYPPSPVPVPEVEPKPEPSAPASADDSSLNFYGGSDVMPWFAIYSLGAGFMIGDLL